ncbi:energy transducer TonB [bacterium]|nr:energy transducer TonB [bacterium]
MNSPSLCFSVLVSLLLHLGALAGCMWCKGVVSVVSPGNEMIVVSLINSLSPAENNSTPARLAISSLPQAESTPEITKVFADEIALKTQARASLNLTPGVTPQNAKLKSQNQKIPSPQNNPSSLSQTHEFTSQAANSGSVIGDSIGGSSSGNSLGPVLVNAPKPAYPRSARLAKFEGSLVVEVTISERGEILEANLVKSSGRIDCDSAALQTIKEKWAFAPARAGAKTVKSSSRVTVSYRLT